MTIDPIDGLFQHLGLKTTEDILGAEAQKRYPGAVVFSRGNGRYAIMPDAGPTVRYIADEGDGIFEGEEGFDEAWDALSGGITAGQINALRNGAATHGDLETVKICDRAKNGSKRAWAQVVARILGVADDMVDG